LPPWTRLAGVAMASAGLFYAGLRLLESRRLYALILMGGAFGFLYLDVYFALKWYHYIDAPLGFGLFMLLGVATVLTAVRMDARALAVLGLFGAFLAPPLASTGSGNHVLLFSYYTLLNLFILAVSWFKSWRDLNLVGFGFTFLISTAWGVRSYQPELFASVEPFVIVFFLIYLAIPLLFATRQKPELKGLVDGTLVFGTPIAAAFLQARVVEGMGDHALAWSAGAVAALYALLGLFTRRREHMELLGETYVALATLLGTMTVFFALDAYPTFALWTLEGAAIVWVGLRQQRRLARAFGLLLQVGAALYFLFHYSQIERANPLFNDFVLGCALIAVAAWISAWLMDRHRELLAEGEITAGNLLLLWGFGWWLGGGLHALHHRLADADLAPAMLLFVTASLLSAELLGAWLPPSGWPALRRMAVLHLIFMIGASFWDAAQHSHPLAGLGALAWPLAFGAHFWILYRQRRDALEAGEELRETAGWLVAAGLATWDAAWLIHHGFNGLALLWAGAGFAAGWMRHHWRERDAGGAPLSRAVLVWALLIWGIAGWNWLELRYTGTPLIFVALACVVASVLLFEIAGSLGRWADLRLAGILLPAAMLVAAVALYERHMHPLAEEGVWVWPLAFGVHFWMLYRQRRDGLMAGADLRDTAGWLLAAGLATWDAGWLIQHGFYGLALLWAGVGFAAGWARHHWRERDAGSAPLSRAVLVWALLIWGIAGWNWLELSYAGTPLLLAALACVAASALLFELAGSLGRWADLRLAAILLPAAMLIAAVALYERHLPPLAEEGAWVWPLAFAVAWLALCRQERDDCAPVARPQHLLLFWLFALVLMWEADARLHLADAALQWQRAAWGVIPALLVASMARLTRRDHWPFQQHALLYRDLALAPLLVLMAGWSVFANLADPGAAVPATHLPLLNPLDLTQMLVLYAGWSWAREAAPDLDATDWVKPLLGALAFVWVNGVALRAIHYYADVPYELRAQLASVLTQSVLSLLWTSCALVLMTWASRRGVRTAWTIGAVLLGVVVLKLVTNDLGNSGTVARIVSFLGVGAMLLLIGYIAPLPPGDTLKEGDGRG